MSMRIKDAAAAVIQQAKDAAAPAVEFYNAHKDTIDKVKESVDNGIQAFGSGKDAFDALKHGVEHGVAKAHEAANPLGKWTTLGKLGQIGSAAGAVAGIATMPKSVGTAVADIRAAVKSGSREDIVKAARSTAEAARTGVTSAQGLLTTAVVGNKLRATYKAAETAFKAAAPTVAPSVAKAAARSAMKATFEGAERAVARTAMKEAVVTAARAEAGTIAKAVAGSASRAVAKATLEGAGKAATHAAVEAGAHAAASTLGRAAARFAPGVNIALAAVDTGVAIATLADSKASLGSKITSCITAAGSITAATNIPVVSQVGAAVSAASSFVGAFFH